jgi:ketosteroid isomerase-like protein
VSRLRFVLVVLLSIPFASGCTTLRPKKATSPIVVVEKYLDALNRRDLMMLTAYVEPDIVWHSVIHGERIQEVAGREALAASLRNYFAQNERTEWHIEQVVTVDQSVAIRERSVWQSSGNSDARTSLAVYELHDGRIARITHYLRAD